MSGRQLLFVAVIACAACGCKSDNSSERPVSKDGTPVANPPPVDDRVAASAALVSMAAETLEQLEALETQADVTCWTSFRQLDWYIAEKTYSEFATVAKVTAIKGLVRALWVKASLSKGDVVTAAAVSAALGSLAVISVADSKKGELSGFANDIGLRNYTDYQKTAEHWRVVLAVVQDEIFFGSGSETIKPATGDALVALADGATTLSLHLLKRSGREATTDKSREIEAKHVKSSFGELARELGLHGTKRPVDRLSHSQAIQILSPLTQQLIKGKGNALLSFNRATGDLAADLSRVSELPIEKDAAKVLYATALSYVRFATTGADPMRADNYLSDGSLVGGSIANAAYIDHLKLQNVVQQTFPHKVLANGDVLTRFEPNPGPLTVGKVDLEPFEIRLLDHRMNGVRDSAVHWTVLADVFSRRRYAIDPFAAEYLSEVVSMMIALSIERSVRLAKSRGEKTVSAEVAEHVAKTNSMIQSPIREDKRPAWDSQWGATKKTALRRVGKVFRDATPKSGLPQKVTVPEAPANVKFDLQMIMGSGVAVGDVNADGYPDVYLAGEGLGRLMINRGKDAPGTFVDATSAWKLPTIEAGRGALLFDLEGDGDLDLLVLRSDRPSRIFRQTGGVFEDATAELGFKTGPGAHAAHAFDFDGDGDLDIYIGYYGSKEGHETKGKNLPSLDGRNGSPNQLWRNDAQTDRIKFVEVGVAQGVADVGWTLAVGSFDYELDGDLDLYLANDFGANTLYRNDGNGSFTDITSATGTGDRGSGMNVDFTDQNGDGEWDLYVTNIDMFSKRIKVVFPRDESTIDLDRELAESFQYLSGNKFYVSGRKPGTVSSGAQAKGALHSAEQALIEPTDHGWGWDALFFDVDNDADDDLYLTNGWLQGSYAGNQRNQLFINEKVFHLFPEAEAASVAGNTRSVAAADFDRDGDIDLILNQFRGPPVMLENVTKSTNKSVRLALKGEGRNPFAVGARVTITAGDKTVLRQVTAGRGYISQADTELVVGVGQARSVDVEVAWPSGKTSSHKNLGVGKRHELSPK